MIRIYQYSIRIYFSVSLDLDFLIRTKFDEKLYEQRYASEKTDNLGTKVLQICFFFVFYSVCKNKQTGHCMNATGDSKNGCC